MTSPASASPGSLIDRSGLDKAHLSRILGHGLEGADDGELFLEYRQAEVLVLLAEGCSNKEMRHRMGIAERTVRAHLTELFHLLGANSRMQAVIRGRELGLIGE